jgi:hypothetical protein
MARALKERIGRLSAVGGWQLRRSSTPGLYYVADRLTGMFLSMNLSLEDLGRKLGALGDGETVSE